MRIAISGTHSMGKSTTVDDFLKAHPEYIHELEPYRALRDDHEFHFAKQSTRYCIQVQLDWLFDRMKRYAAGDNVIYDRCPVDFIPYSLYTDKYGLTDLNLTYIERAVPVIRESLQYLDIIVFLPITDKHLVELEDDHIRPIEAEYRQEVDEYFKSVYRELIYDILPKNNPPKILELWGSREERIKKIKALL